MPLCLLAEEELPTLETLLAEASDSARSERLNLDYTPSVVSVLEHEQMRLLGIKTVFEALSILPGVETGVTQFGVKKVIIRGFDNPNNFAFDKSKLLIDGVPVETAFLFNTSSFLELPVDIVERIELLRGPASALYGNGAFNGAINVVTRQDPGLGSALFAGAGSYGYTMGGTRVQYRLGSQERFHADVYVQRSDKQLPVGADFAPVRILDRTTGEVVSFPRDYETNEQLNDYGIGLLYENGGVRIRARLMDRSTGNFYGWNERLEMTEDRRSSERYCFVEAGYGRNVAPRTFLRTSLAFSRYRLDVDAQDYAKQNDLQIPYAFSLREVEQTFRFENALVGRRFPGHSIEAGVLVQSTWQLHNRIDDDISAYGARDMVEAGLYRDFAAFYLRDTWEVSETTTLFAALRGDYYMREARLYPSVQAGLLYTPSEMFQLKLNYGHAYRLPSWVEQYTVQYGPGDGTRLGNPALREETTDTFEAVGIFKFSPRQRLQVNGYYSLQKSVIDIDDVNDGYSNRPDRSSTGAELAYDLTLLVQDRFSANLSYTHTTYITPQYGIRQLMPTAAMWMAKGYFIHYFTPGVSLALLGKWIGTRPRNEDFDLSHAENRSLDPYATLDVTAGWKTASHWTLSLSLKNVADADIRYPSYYDRHEEGIPREGRHFLMEAEYRF